MRTEQKNGVQFNVSEKGEWVIVYDGVNVLEFGEFNGKVHSKNDMFTSNNEQDCLDFIAENNLIIQEIEE